MTEAHPAHSTRRASRDHEATPSIAIMTLLTGLGGSLMGGSVCPGTVRRWAERPPRTCS